MPTLSHPAHPPSNYAPRVRVGRLAVALARTTGRSPGGCHQSLLTERVALERVVRVGVRAGLHAEVLSHIAPAIAFIDGPWPSGCLDAATLEEVRAESAANVAYQEYVAAGRTDEAWKPLERKLLSDIAATFGLIAAGRARHVRGV